MRGFFLRRRSLGTPPEGPTIASASRVPPFDEYLHSWLAANGSEIDDNAPGAKCVATQALFVNPIGVATARVAPRVVVPGPPDPQCPVWCSLLRIKNLNNFVGVQ